MKEALQFLKLERDAGKISQHTFYRVCNWMGLRKRLISKRRKFRIYPYCDPEGKWLGWLVVAGSPLNGMDATSALFTDYTKLCGIVPA